MTAVVVNKRSKHFVRNDNQVYIGRGSPWGNPFTHLPLSRTKAQFQVATEEESMTSYEAWLRERLAKEPQLRRQLLKLDGHELVCYCNPRPCHGDILIKLIEELKTTIRPSDDAAASGSGDGSHATVRLPSSQQA